MTAFTLRVLTQNPLLLLAAMTWKCDQCHAINSDSSVTCYRCGA